MHDPVARVLAIYRRESGDPPFTVVQASLRTDGIADAARQIEVDADARRLLGRACDARRWLAAHADAPASERDEALDALVTAALGDPGDDARFVERARQVSTLGTEFATAVARVRLVRELLRPLDDEDGDAMVAESRPSLVPPCAFGPPFGGHPHRFELLRRLGEGAHGVVFEAIDHRYTEGDYQHRVVVKVLPPELADRAEGELLRGSRVQHPNVVRWLDSGIDPSGCGYVVSELVRARTLEDEGVVESIGRRGAVNALREVALAIDAAHGASVLHLDLKPANVLVAADGSARLCDFGAARPISVDGRADEATPFFAAPEVLEGSPAGVAADVYALGAVLRWCMDALDDAGAPPLERLDAERLEAIWSRAMDPRPERRHAAAREFARDLEAWLDRRPLPSDAMSLPASLRLSIRRDPTTWLLGSAAVVAVLLLGWSWIGGRIAESNRRAERMVENAKKLQAGAMLGLYVERLGQLASADGLSAAPHILAMHWLVGPSGLGNGELLARTRTAQIQAWLAILRDAERAGTLDHLEAKLAALCLAASDLETDHVARAAHRMHGDLPWWREHFAESDPARVVAEGIAALADIGMRASVSAAEADEWRPRLEKMRVSLLERDPKLARLAEAALVRLTRKAP